MADLVVTLPETTLAEAVGERPGIRVAVWDLQGLPDVAAEAEVVVPPYQYAAARFPVLAQVPRLQLVQTLTAGYDDVLPHLPDGVALANAAGVHDASTSELAVALALAALRGIPDYVRDGEHGRWKAQRRRSLADRRVLVVGYGGVGRGVAARVAPFEASVTAVASRARATGPDGVPVHGVDELPALLPEHDVVVLATPLTDATRGLVDAAFLAAMPDGALLVNVARGPVVDTEALLAELQAGRLQAALDVTEPEPLPADHPLWSAPGVLISPHVGGATSAFFPRAVRMLQAQLDRLASGEPLRGVVVPSEWTRAREE
jgi:phosphoglycerate dehydrogenase-like enzyme